MHLALEQMPACYYTIVCGKTIIGVKTMAVVTAATLWCTLRTPEDTKEMD